MAFGVAPKSLTLPVSGVEEVTNAAAIQLPESAQIQLPEAAVSIARSNCQKQLPESAKPIARSVAFQLPEKSVTVATIGIQGLFEKLKNAQRQLPESAQNQQRNIVRSRMWRIEKDGHGGYQWRLKNSKERISIPVAFGEEVGAAIQARTGRGNSARSRADGARFRVEIERLEFVHRATKKRRTRCVNRKRRPASGNRSGRCKSM